MKETDSVDDCDNAVLDYMGVCMRYNLPSNLFVCLKEPDSADDYDNAMLDYMGVCPRPSSTWRLNFCASPSTIKTVIIAPSEKTLHGIYIS